MRAIANFSVMGILLSANLALAYEPMTPERQAEETYSFARNEIGVLKYCYSKEYISMKPISAKEKVTQKILQMPEDTSKGDAAEEDGKNGIVSVLGLKGSVADSAKMRKISEKEYCRKMADEVMEMYSAIFPK